MQKEVFDMRGKETSIMRLAAFDSAAFVHMVFYRILIFVVIAYGIIILLSYAVQGLAFEVKFATALAWILFTPQVFETAKGIVLVLSGGMAMGHLNEEYKMAMKAKHHSLRGALAVIPYAVLLLWLAGFMMMLIWWSL
jgi:hypothetical protein